MKRGTAHLPLHGGKDGHPFPVDRATYDGTISAGASIRPDFPRDTTREA